MFNAFVEIAKVSSVHCSTSGLALGSPGCLFVCCCGFCLSRILHYFPMSLIVSDFAKVSSVHCSTSGLALGSPGCSFVVCRSSPCPKYLINPYNAIFLKSQGSKDIKNDILDPQIHKYTNTQIQIHKYSL